MEKISFINGSFLPHSQCLVSIEDRGFQFADGVYEVVLFHNNKLVDLEWHLDRLFRSMRELEIKLDKTRKELAELFLSLFEKNHLSDGSIYLQITRGSSPRNQAFPQGCAATIVAVVSPSKLLTIQELSNGFTAITHPDIRWGRCDIKSVALLAGVLARQKAESLGASEAILIKDGYVTEGSFSNVFIVDDFGNLVTREADNNILCGITRNRIIALAQANKIPLIERKFSRGELLGAKEVFTSSSTLIIRPIVKIDGETVGNGKVGEVTKNLIDCYYNFLNS